MPIPDQISSLSSVVLPRHPWAHLDLSVPEMQGNREATNDPKGRHGPAASRDACTKHQTTCGSTPKKSSRPAMKRTVSSTDDESLVNCLIRVSSVFHLWLNSPVSYGTNAPPREECFSVKSDSL
jgi:hypothetical protein